MKTPRRSSQPPAHPAAAGRGWRPSLGYLAIALVLVAGGLIFLLMSSDEADNTAAPASSPRDAVVTWTPPALPSPPVAQDASPPLRDGVDPTRDLSSYVARGEKPTMPEVITRLHEAGVHTGLGAFSPPGTRPPLIGLAVPEDFVLPKGYVRHHQATDDGQRIEAILMYAPDQQLVDAANLPITIPKDRVVPPELAPPGLPIRRIVVPAPIEPR